MNKGNNNVINTVLVPALTPEFLDRGSLWWDDQRKELLRAVEELPWWREHIVVLRVGDDIQLSPLLRRLTDFGYERVHRVLEPGQLAARGGIVDVYSVGSDNAVRIEFVGSCIESMQVLSSSFLEKEASRAARRRADRTFLRMLRFGDYIVHRDHGIGIFLERVVRRPSSDMKPTAYIVLEYAKGDTLSVPESIAAEAVTKYIGFRAPVVHRLGGEVWLKTKRKARGDAEKFAKELLKLYARREESEGFAFPRGDDLERSFAQTFPFVETPDQERAIQEVLQDMQRLRPMDRLLCGDVGFGKTEIVLRAAVKAAHAGKQVAVLAPTTILTHQHFKTFIDRFRNFPFRVAMLSRVVAPAEERAILADITSGNVDIVIGTHRIFSKDVHFNNLGLVVIDEEQRFGVKHKERFKEMRADVDMLSLSATPIPRSLNMALAGLRDLSIIATPPPHRIPVETIVGCYDDEIVVVALRHELDRGGQAYVLHNRITTIEGVADRIRKTIPHAVVEVAHGQLPERELLRVMERFGEGKIDVLVATTIIENGLDFSSVNTLVVDDASKLGLSQAHQIRGRVGRGSKKAFAYFLIPNKKLTSKASQRLEVLQQAVELGAGYEIAIRDMEIRGAGNLLGREQSGTAYKVGLNLYSQMLADAIEQQKEY